MASVLTNAGKAIVVQRLMGSGASPKYLGWGTGAGTAVVGNTTLFTEAAEARATGTESAQTTSVSGDTYRVIASLTVTGSVKTITNVGLFDASSSGNLFIQIDFTGILLNVGEGLTFTISWQLQT
jgi:hypothetical protein